MKKVKIKREDSLRIKFILENMLVDFSMQDDLVYINEDDLESFTNILEQDRMWFKVVS